MKKSDNWQDIETAPTNRRVILGRWAWFLGNLQWEEDVGTAYRSSWFGLGREKTYDGHRNSHWRQLPPPGGEPKP